MAIAEVEELSVSRSVRHSDKRGDTTSRLARSRECDVTDLDDWLLHDIGVLRELRYRRQREAAARRADRLFWRL